MPSGPADTPVTGTTPVSSDTRALAAREAATSLDFPGWGNAERMDSLDEGDPHITHLDQPFKHRLGVWGATAIGGNDITSSVLCESALAAAEAVECCLPLNGRTYTVHRNTTNKKTAAARACATLVSYISTAVISARGSMHYGHNLVGSSDIPAELTEQLATIDRIYPRTANRSFAGTSSFGPEMIERLAQRLRVPKNLMFIGTPGDRFPHRIDSHAGVRAIL